MEFDNESIQLRIDIIERNLAEIAKIVSEGYEQFDYRNQLASKHALQESIESCIDIANHIIATMGFRRPNDYRDVFIVLEENDILNKELSAKLQAMASFRNLLVFRYADMDKIKLFKIMKIETNDFNDFIVQILGYIN
ncbi:MAG: DUF86 domain-containing protein [Methanobacteriaceae archaeon]|nr:DUF86 domain-containing protein [Methanobacteriaceae archaeon]